MRKSINIEDLIEVLESRQRFLEKVNTDAPKYGLNTYSDFVFGRTTEVEFLLDLFKDKVAKAAKSGKAPVI